MKSVSDESPVVTQAGAEGVKRISILRSERDSPAAREDAVAVEEPLEIQLSFEKKGIRAVKNVSVTMRTPGHDRELAAGFLFTEGIIGGAGDIGDWELPEASRPGPAGGNSLRAVLRDGVAVDLRALERHFYTTSSCGVCGKTSLEALRVTGRISLAPDRPVWDSARIGELPRTLRSDQLIFQETGGLHAAGLFREDGTLVAVREDVGRHNAVDKLIGEQVLAGNCAVLPRQHLLRQRPGELRARPEGRHAAGIPILAAVGAPSSLAVDLARQFGATLLGFVGPTRFNVYSGAQRIRFTAK